MFIARQLCYQMARGLPWTRVAQSVHRYASNKPDRADNAVALATPEELEQREKLKRSITVVTQVNTSALSGVPDQQIRTRLARIHQPAKNAMQSGTNNLGQWRIDFDNRERWENPLMGWTSSGDPLSNMLLKFSDMDEAIRYCERNGWRWYLDAPTKPKTKKTRDYAANFAYNKRSRLSTK